MVMDKETADEIYEDMKERYKGKYGMIRITPHYWEKHYLAGYSIQIQ